MFLKVKRQTQTNRVNNRKHNYTKVEDSNKDNRLALLGMSRTGTMTINTVAKRIPLIVATHKENSN